MGATETSLEQLLLIGLGRACGVRSRGWKLVSGIAELEVEVGQNQQVFLFAAESRGPGGDDVSRPKGGESGGLEEAAPALLWMFGSLTNCSPFRPNSPLFLVFASMLSQPVGLDARAPRLGNAKEEV